MVVKEHIGQMRRQQCINAATGANEKHLGIKDAGAQRASQHAWEVDAGDARRSMHHLQGQAEEQLNGHVESQMEPASMQHHI